MLFSRENLWVVFPCRLFLRNQFIEFGYTHPGATLIHDNSNELRWFPYEQFNIKGVGIVPYSPDMNAYAERFVRSIRQECLDYFIIITYGQLHRIVKSYIGYYNNYRPHQGLKGIPNGQSEQPSTGVLSRSQFYLDCITITTEKLHNWLSRNISFPMLFSRESYVRVSGKNLVLGIVLGKKFLIFVI